MTAEHVYTILANDGGGGRGGGGGGGIPAPRFDVGGGLNLREGGGLIASYTLRLETAPLSPVTVTVDADPRLEVSTTTVVFTPDNYDEPVTVEVAPRQDGTNPGPYAEIRHVFATADLTSEPDPLRVVIIDDDPVSGGGGGGGLGAAGGGTAGGFGSGTPDVNGLAIPEGGFRIEPADGRSTVAGRAVRLRMVGRPDPLREPYARTMALSRTPDFSAVPSQPYASVIDWDLCGAMVECPEGVYPIYGRFFGPNGTASPLVVAWIELRPSAGIGADEPASRPPAVLFLRPLAPGDVGKDVDRLRSFLADRGFLTGPIDPAGGTAYDEAVSQAVARFQEAHPRTVLAPQGLAKGTGMFDPLTLNAANALLRMGL